MNQLEKVALLMSAVENPLAFAMSVSYTEFIESVMKCEDERIKHLSADELLKAGLDALDACKGDVPHAKVVLLSNLIEDFQLRKESNSPVVDGLDLVAQVFTTPDGIDFCAALGQTNGNNKASVKKSYAEALGVELGLLDKNEVLMYRIVNAIGALGDAIEGLNAAQKKAVENAIAILVPAVYSVTNH